MSKTLIPDEILAQLEAAAEKAGYDGKRKDSKKSRWNYLSKLIALGEIYKDAIRLK